MWLLVVTLGLFVSDGGTLITHGESHCGAGKCYKYYRTASSFDEAGDVCKKAGTSLATVTSAEEQATFETAMAQAGVSFTWLDIHEEVGTQLSWKWLDGTLLKAQGCYSEWTFGRVFPNETIIPQLVPEKCVTACKDKGFWYSSVQEGWRCFCGPTPTYRSTDRGCTFACTGDNDEWCGAFGKAFVYFNHGTYGEWAYNQPNNENFREDCAAILSVDPRYRFSDRDCTALLPYLCDLPVSACGVESDSDGYLVKNSTKCLYISTTSVSWYSAVTLCTAKGGELVKIDSRETHDMYQVAIQTLKGVGKVPNDLAGPMFWIGLQKRRFANHYTKGTSTTNAVLRYYNFGANQPDWFMWECVQVNATDGYKWHETWCDPIESNQPFFCESAYIQTDTTQLSSTSTQSPTRTVTTSTQSPTRTVTTSATEATTVVSTQPASSNSDQTESTTTTATTTTTTTSTTTTTASESSSESSTSAPSSTISSTDSVTPSAGASTGGGSGSLTTLEIVFLLFAILLLIALIVVIVVFVVYKNKNNDRNQIAPEYRSGYGAPRPTHYDGRDGARVPATSRPAPDQVYIDQGETSSNFSTDGSVYTGYDSKQGIFMKDKDMWK